MSERWLECTPCTDSHCFRCDDTGMRGDALAYLMIEDSKEWEQSHPAPDPFNFDGFGLLRAEDLQSENTKAMEAAILAITITKTNRSMTNGI